MNHNRKKEKTKTKRKTKSINDRKLRSTVTSNHKPKTLQEETPIKMVGMKEMKNKKITTSNKKTPKGSKFSQMKRRKTETSKSDQKKKKLVSNFFRSRSNKTLPKKTKVSEKNKPLTHHTRSPQSTTKKLKSKSSKNLLKNKPLKAKRLSQSPRSPRTPLSPNVKQFQDFTTCTTLEKIELKLEEMEKVRNNSAKITKLKTLLKSVARSMDRLYLQNEKEKKKFKKHQEEMLFFESTIDEFDQEKKERENKIKLILQERADLVELVESSTKMLNLKATELMKKEQHILKLEKKIFDDTTLINKLKQKNHNLIKDKKKKKINHDNNSGHNGIQNSHTNSQITKLQLAKLLKDISSTEKYDSKISISDEKDSLLGQLRNVLISQQDTITKIRKQTKKKDKQLTLQSKHYQTENKNLLKELHLRNKKIDRLKKLLLKYEQRNLKNSNGKKKAGQGNNKEMKKMKSIFKDLESLRSNRPKTKKKYNRDMSTLLDKKKKKKRNNLQKKYSRKSRTVNNKNYEEFVQMKEQMEKEGKDLDNFDFKTNLKKLGKKSKDKGNSKKGKLKFKIGKKRVNEKEEKERNIENEQLQENVMSDEKKNDQEKEIQDGEIQNQDNVNENENEKEKENNESNNESDEMTKEKKNYEKNEENNIKDIRETGEYNEHQVIEKTEKNDGFSRNKKQKDNDENEVMGENIENIKGPKNTNQIQKHIKTQTEEEENEKKNYGNTEKEQVHGQGKEQKKENEKDDEEKNTMKDENFEYKGLLERFEKKKENEEEEKINSTTNEENEEKTKKDNKLNKFIEIFEKKENEDKGYEELKKKNEEIEKEIIKQKQNKLKMLLQLFENNSLIEEKPMKVVEKEKERERERGKEKEMETEKKPKLPSRKYRTLQNNNQKKAYLNPKDVKEKETQKIIVTEKQAATNIQALFRGYQKRKKFKQLEKRIKICNEILGTEREYISRIKTLLESYLIPIIHNEFIEGDDVKYLKNELEMILGLSKKILILLETGVPKVNYTQTDEIGKIFKNISPAMIVYTAYVNRYSTLFTLTKEARTKNLIFDEFLYTQKLQEKSKLGLFDLLIAPIQRVPRYLLLLKELLKYSEQDHPDYKYLESALESISKQANILNESKREFTKIQKVFKISQKLRNCKNFNLLDTPSRCFIKKNEIKNIVDKRIKNRVGILFTDLILIIQIKKKKLKFQKNKENKAYDLKNIFYINKATQLIRTKQNDDLFFLLNDKNNIQNDLILMATSIENRDQWIQDIEKIIEKNSQNQFLPSSSSSDSLDNILTNDKNLNNSSEKQSNIEDGQKLKRKSTVRLKWNIGRKKPLPEEEKI
ncbi:faciogenital dysplasia protein [Anaeramoeba flamelloides]|uniref:Faciogenital dysplasia protein n=1 Tax=Anaeramoeba flamelloides TaxID=1746091 RepID=A0AAV7Z1Z4_9EUKA|nr:faciogenital dysplasia protein [Anaeramoeba flamelloides]